jgi:hypothetical protein
VQRPKKIKIESNEYTITMDGDNFEITENGVTLNGHTDDLTIPQRVWLDNIIACSDSLLMTLNLNGLTRGI